MLALEAANYDPLRAKDIYENVDQLWWERYMVERRHRLRSMELKSKGS